MTECFFCGEEMHGSRQLASHLLADHEREEIGLDGTEYGLGLGEMPGWVYCWCGYLVCEPRQLADHLDDCGGMEAHLLECGLGLTP